MTLLTIAVNGPPRVATHETTCTVDAGRDVGVAWAERDEHRGVTWWFERRARGGRRIGRPVELGWGYDGAETCALGYDRGRYLATWAWWDPYGSRPELRTAVVERDRRIAQHGMYVGPYFDVAPVRVLPARDGWTIEYRLEPDGEIHRIHADRDGRLRR
jgi:hypothetical protein